MYKLILIKKDTPSSICWKNLIKSNQIADLSVTEVVSKYQGFEGELIYSLEPGTKNIKDLINNQLRINNFENYSLLHVISTENTISNIINNDARKVGYDVGVCEEEKTIYSSIYNEVIFGYFEELIKFKDILNENLLFPNRSIAEKYLILHNQMSVQGKGVEDYETLDIYEIWKQDI